MFYFSSTLCTMMEDPAMSTGLSSPRSSSSSVDKDDPLHNPNSPTSVTSIPDGNSGPCHTVLMCGQPIAALVIDGGERLCLAQISNTLLKNFSYNEIHNRRVALGITCVQCTPVQLEILRRAGAMPVSSRRCGMISKREAERLCKSFLCDNLPPKLPDNFAFEVHHLCGWGCRGNFVPSRYNSSRAKCIKCIYCNLYFSPNKFIFHSHRIPTSKYRQPDAANFNSWRRHINLADDETGDALLHAWEDVKAMFNGGSRKRSMYHATATTSSSKPSSHKTNSLELNPPPVPKRNRLELDPVLSNLSVGRAIPYPIMPIPNRSFATPVNESISTEKRDTFFSTTNTNSMNSVFGRQFTAQSVRPPPRTFTDLFWPNSRVPYPFPTGFWPKSRDSNLAMFPGAAAAAMDKKFGTYCSLAPESFLGNWQLSPASTPNMIDSEREEIKEDIKMRYMSPMSSSHGQEHIDIENSNKYLSAFRRVGKITSSPERDIGGGILESGRNEMPERFTSSPASDTRDGADSYSPLGGLGTSGKRLFTAPAAHTSDSYCKGDDGCECVEEMNARKRDHGSPIGSLPGGREDVDIQEDDDATSNNGGGEEEGKRRRNNSEDTTDVDRKVGLTVMMRT